MRRGWPATRFNVGWPPARSETFRGVGTERPRVYGSRIVTGLAAVFAGMAALFLVLSVVYGPVFVPVAAMFGVAAYFVWYHASGRFARRLYQGVESRAEPAEGGGFGSGPREEWVPPRDERRQRARATGRRRAGARRQRVGGGTGQRRRPSPPSDGPTASEAYDTLGLDDGADEQAVKRAYREKVKEVHPDRPSGDEDAFKEVTAAYERLTD